MKSKAQCETLSKGVWNLWLNWCVPFGVVMLLFIAAPMYGDVFTVVSSFFILCFANTVIFVNRRDNSKYCLIVPYLIELVLVLTVVFIFVLNIIGQNFITEISGQPYNYSLPKMPVLFFAPFALILTVWLKYKKRKCAFCQDCLSRLGMSSERSLLSRIYYKEATLQTDLIVYISIVLTVIEWAFYFKFYINTNFNSLDIYIYVWLPVTIFGSSVIFFTFRYYALKRYLCSDDCVISTKVRFLLVHGNKICIKNGDIFFDTPVKTEIPYHNSISELEVNGIFSNLSDYKNVKIRFLYQNSDFKTIANVFHYAVFIHGDLKIDEEKSLEWFNLEELKFLMGIKVVSPLLLNEINRVYTYAMTWKTYDKSGKRRYKVRYYKPTFRLEDMESWNIDYNDPTWLYVSKVNEDSRFFKMKLFWHRYILGFVKTCNSTD